MLWQQKDGAVIIKKEYEIAAINVVEKGRSVELVNGRPETEEGRL